MTRHIGVALVAAALVASACGGSASDTGDFAPAAGQGISVDPVAPVVPGGGTQTFASAVTGATTRSVTWTVQEGSSCGSVSSAGVYTAPAAGTTCHVVATSVADATKSGSATVTVSVSTGGTDLSGTITTRTLTLAGSPYRVTGDVTVPAGNRLTIEPGVHIVFQGRFRMSVAGRMTAQGIAGQEILFTHKDGSNTQGWNGLRFSSSTSLVGGVGDIIEHCIFEYGVKSGASGAGSDGPYSETGGGAVWVYDRANFAFNNNEVRHCKANEWGGGMVVIQPNGPGTMTGNNFHDNEETTKAKGYGGGIWFGHVMYVNTWTVRGGSFRNNSATVFGGGIAIYDANVILDSIAMSGNFVGSTPNDYQTENASRLTVINTPLP